MAKSNFTSADYLNYANAIAQYMALHDRLMMPAHKKACLEIAEDILDILNPPEPKAKVLQLVHNKDDSNA